MYVEEYKGYGNCPDPLGIMQSQFRLARRSQLSYHFTAWDVYFTGQGPSLSTFKAF